MQTRPALGPHKHSSFPEAPGWPALSPREGRRWLLACVHLHLSHLWLFRRLVWIQRQWPCGPAGCAGWCRSAILGRMYIPCWPLCSMRVLPLPVHGSCSGRGGRQRCCLWLLAQGGGSRLDGLLDVSHRSDTINMDKQTNRNTPCTPVWQTPRGHEAQPGQRCLPPTQAHPACLAQSALQLSQKSSSRLAVSSAPGCRHDTSLDAARGVAPLTWQAEACPAPCEGAQQ